MTTADFVPKLLFPQIWGFSPKNTPCLSDVALAGIVMVQYKSISMNTLSKRLILYLDISIEWPKWVGPDLEFWFSIFDFLIFDFWFSIFLFFWKIFFFWIFFLNFFFEFFDHSIHWYYCCCWFSDRYGHFFENVLTLKFFFSDIQIIK